MGVRYMVSILSHVVCRQYHKIHVNTKRKQSFREQRERESRKEYHFYHTMFKVPKKRRMTCNCIVVNIKWRFCVTDSVRVTLISSHVKRIFQIFTANDAIHTYDTVSIFVAFRILVYSNETVYFGIFFFSLLLNSIMFASHFKIISLIFSQWIRA